MEILFHAIEKVAELLLAVGVVEALHSHGVGDGAEGVEGCATDFSGGRIFIRKFRVGGFEIEKLAVEAVVGGIGNFGLGLYIIEMIVATDLLQEACVTLGGRGAHRRRRRRASPREMPRISANQSRTETSRPGERRWLCSSRAPRSEPAIPRATGG